MIRFRMACIKFADLHSQGWPQQRDRVESGCEHQMHAYISTLSGGGVEEYMVQTEGMQLLPRETIEQMHRGSMHRPSRVAFVADIGMTDTDYLLETEYI